MKNAQNQEIIPIKSLEEASQVVWFILQQTMEKQNIDQDQAEKRLKSLLESKELMSLTPGSKLFILTVDKYMTKQVD